MMLYCRLLGTVLLVYRLCCRPGELPAAVGTVAGGVRL